MKISVISFTKQGQMLAERIREYMGEEDEITVYTKGSSQNVQEPQAVINRTKRTEQETNTAKTAVSQKNMTEESMTVSKNPDTIAVTTSLTEWTGEQMVAHRALVFISACGIAVRAIAPWITDKLHDSPVIVMDEQGQHVIPLLSGHVGGANELALRLSEAIGAIPVVTTATDLQGSFAIDLFAKKNDLWIRNREGIAKVSAKVLAGSEITMCVRTGHLETCENLPDGIRLCEYPPEEPVDVLVTENHSVSDTVARDLLEQKYRSPLSVSMEQLQSDVYSKAQLILHPKKYVLGVGCKKETDSAKLEDYLQSILEQQGISIEEIVALASIDVKKDETCLLKFSEKHRIPFRTYSAQKLQAVPGEFHSSAFVKNTVGVDNVCERAAICAAGDGGRLMLSKQANDGMTVAIVEKIWKVVF